MAFHKYPYTDQHEINLDWFLGQFKKLVSEFKRLEKEIADIDTSGTSVPDEVRHALFALLDDAVYHETDLTDEKAIIQSWANSTVTAISLSPVTLTFTGSGSQSITATTVPAGEPVAWSSSNTSVATVSNGVVTAVGNGTCTITASSGNVSASCEVTVSGILATYTITNTLTNVTNSNSNSAIGEGASYTATLTADSGYELGTVTVTMGGADVTSTVYSNGTITISSVTGNIVITAFGVVSLLLYNWDLTSSLTDTVNGLTATLGSNGTAALPELTASGLVFNAATQELILGNIDLRNKTIELDIASFAFAGNSSYHVRFLMNQYKVLTNIYGYSPLIFRSEYGWSGYGTVSSSVSGSSNASDRTWSAQGWGNLYNTSSINALDGKTVKIVFNADVSRELYVDDVLIGTMNDIFFGSQAANQSIRIGGCESYDQTKGDQCYNMTITGIRIYQL